MAEALPTKLLYIAGTGRSGSTLLECILGQLPGVFAAGEVTHIWDRGYRQNQLCGCGEPFRDCAFWLAVTREAFGGSDRLDYSALIELRGVICSLTRVPQLLKPRLRTKSFQSKLDIYREHLAKLYSAIRTVSGCELIVDSSKYPAELFLLKSIDAVDLSVAHIVRNSNAVAYAWQKRKVRPEIFWTTEHFARYSFLKTAVAWNVFNLVIGSVERLNVPYAMVRYEDLVERPAATIRELIELLGRDGEDLDFIGETSVQMRGNHTVSGNPSRFKTGEVSLRLDTEWQEKCPPLQKLLVDLVTLPVRKRYDYR
ncbi:MAG: sulfotransferase [Gemmatimonadota bacterium]|nr:MAG: sulfotransferase [Gemmatimonadota bacterium]